MRKGKIIRTLIQTAVITACAGFYFGLMSAQAQDKQTLQPHVRAIEDAIASRSLPTIREYLNPRKTYIEILGKPSSYLSVNQAVAVIESFLREYTPIGYAKGIVKQSTITGIAISSLRVKSASGLRSLKLTLGFTKDTVTHWLINRIIIR